MYAVIRTGGKQYKVAENDVIDVEKLPGAAGETVELGEVLMLEGSGGAEIGAPLVPGARVMATILEQKRGEKILVFKKKRRKKYRRLNGHRQSLTVLRVTDVLAAGARPKPVTAQKAAVKKAAPVETAPVETAPVETAPVETAKAKAEPAKAPAKAKTPAKAAAAPAKTAKAPAKAKTAAKPAARKTAVKAKTAAKPAVKKAAAAKKSATVKKAPAKAKSAKGTGKEKK